MSPLATDSPIAKVVRAAFIEGAAVLAPPPKISIAEWAERNFVLSSEDSAEPGPYRIARAPYQREILNSIQDSRVEEVVLQMAAQTAKTLCMKIWIAYFVKEDPSPIIFLLPGLDLAKRVSRQRLAPMFRDVPALRGLLEAGANKASNSTLEKVFPGGVLFLVGANSPAGLSSMPARILVADEINRYPASAGSEGNPLSLAEERTNTFWNRKKIKGSTPTDEHGEITAAYEDTSMEQFWVPCVQCGEFQVLTWKQMQLDRTPPHTGTVYECAHCQAALTELDKTAMLAHGEWRARRPEITKKRGFHLSAIYSPFVKWAELAAKWENAMRLRHDREVLKTFINLSLAEPFNDEAERLDADDLIGRVEDYPCSAPDGVIIITAGVDVQRDRLEFTARGWGLNNESWQIDRKVFDGDTSKLKGHCAKQDAADVVGTYVRSPWEELDAYLSRAYYLHARGVRLPIACTFVDSGDQTQVVYEFVKTRQARWIYASKGKAGFGRPVLGPFTKNNSMKVRLYQVGVDEAKQLIYRRLKNGTPGAGFMHFRREYADQDFFKQLTCEQLKRKSVKGFSVRYWEKPAGARNEALDLEVLALAAFLRLSPRPEEFLEAQRRLLLERAKGAAAARRAGTDPNQLGLLDAPVDAAPVEEGEEEEEPVQAPAEEDAVAPEPEPVPEPQPVPAKPQVKFRRGGWVNNF